ncbi:glucokinase [Legionella nagasakiensis]|uniref:glucokinase n=1 Tax=Legionella nagasakiensis TaxID=535290 RepID=UPI001055E147|nr:glucokinase [Legionella nagasakiensis]
MNRQPDDAIAIVADIGGTNARFACVNTRRFIIKNVVTYRCADFVNFAEAFLTYQQQQGLMTVKQAAIAVACPVHDDWIRMTNLDWQFSINEMKRHLGLHHLMIMNDFAAVAMSLMQLPPEEKIQIGEGGIKNKKPVVFLGPGTGLGLAYLIPHEDRYLPFPSEGGHMGWKAQTEQEWFIHRFLTRQHGHVSVERVLSGAGLESLYLALADYKKQVAEPRSASDITALALTGESSLAVDAVNQFFASLGSFAGDLALNLNAFGGVYIAGGIVPKLLPLLLQSKFRARFEEKGRFHLFNRQIATYVITTEQPGLLGAAVYLKQNGMEKVHDVL